MKLLIFIFFWLFLVTVSAQNVGQPGNDSIINYTDIQGNKQGKWMKKYKNGTIAYIGYFKNNMLVGTYKRWYTSGALMCEINYNYDGSVGYARLYWDNGKLMAKGKYINQNIKDSVWEYYGVDGKLMRRETFVKGVLNGDSYSFYRDGKPSCHATYKNGKLDGIYREFWEDNGQVRLEIHYKDSVRYGPLRVYYYNGKMYIDGNYYDDLPHGKWKIYKENGTLDRELEYIRGHLKDEEERDRAFAKQVLEWEKIKGKIPEPREEDFFDPKFNPNKNSRALDEY